MNYTSEEVDKLCRDNPDLASANGIIQAVKKQVKVKSLPAIPSPERANKYNAQRTEVYGITFDSKKEAERFRELSLLEKAGEIINLNVHIRFPLPGGIFYESDFTYLDENLNVVVEDVKGMKTNTYKLKKKLFEERYPVKITEI